VEFSSNLSANYTKWGAQIFPPIFELFAIFDRNLAKIVAPPSDKNKNNLAILKVQSILEKGENRIKIDPYFRTYSRRALFDLPQTLHDGRARRAHPKMCQPFFDPIHSFSARGKNADFLAIG